MTEKPVADVGQRLDQWLWHARIAKTRTLAQALIDRGKVRINRDKVAKPAVTLKPGDVITIALGPRVRILRCLAAGARRGPATEAALLYEELTPVVDQTKPAADGNGAQAHSSDIQPGQVIRFRGSGRPTKRDRRILERLTGR